MDAERLQKENEILRAEWARVDDENRRLKNQDAEIEQLRLQLRETQEMLRNVIDRVVAPLAKKTWGKWLIDKNLDLLNLAVRFLGLTSVDTPDRAPRHPVGSHK